MNSRYRVKRYQGMSGSASPSSYETGSTDSTNDDYYFDEVSSTTGKSSGSRLSNSSRYKTELCRTFYEQGRCKYGNKCQFAHGDSELRVVARHPRYKTEPCKRFHSTGFCSYGTRCHFLHDLSEVSSSTDVKRVSRFEEEEVPQNPAVSSTTFHMEGSSGRIPAWDPPTLPPGLSKMANDNVKNRLDAMYLAGVGQLIQQQAGNMRDNNLAGQMGAQIQQLLQSLNAMNIQLPLGGSI